MRSTTPIAFLLAGALVLPGCGDDAPAQPAEPEPAGRADAPRPERERVRIVDFEFEPKRIEVARGTRVRWVNRDASNHTVTFERRPGDLGNVDEGERLHARFKARGRFAYVCTYHPSMQGIVVVR